MSISQEETVQGKTPTQNPFPNRLPFLLISILILIAGFVAGYVFARMSRNEETSPSNVLPKSENKTMPAMEIINKTTPKVGTIIPTILPSIMPTGLPSLSAENMKSYVSPGSDLTFNYPGDGIVKENAVNNDDEITIHTANLHLLTNIDIQNPPGINYSKAYKRGQNWYDLKFKIYNNLQAISLNDIIVSLLTNVKSVASDDGTAGILGDWISSDAGSYKDAIFSHNGRIYLFEITGGNGEVDDKAESVFADILSSLHFTK